MKWVSGARQNTATTTEFDKWISVALEFEMMTRSSSVELGFAAADTS